MLGDLHSGLEQKLAEGLSIALHADPMQLPLADVEQLRQVAAGAAGLPVMGRDLLLNLLRPVFLAQMGGCRIASGSGGQGPRQICQQGAELP